MSIRFDMKASNELQRRFYGIGSLNPESFPRIPGPALNPDP
jgi:hypothetical protein